MALDIPHALLEEISKGRVSLFLGAGASREAAFPSATQLATHLAQKAGEQHARVLDTQPLDMVAEYLYALPGYGKAWVRQQIIDYFESKHRAVKRPPSRAHQLMTRIKWRTVFTTNYDRLVEIAYDSSSDSVQRLLPIYTPDPQIQRHESEVLRLLKLNGSVDEAARNVKHDLVLTFAEQQEAASKHKEFYDLLRQEAINGPILFVGFRFAHPGASMGGTSPEFLILQQILREMGPAARWHYCIGPQDATANPIEAIATNILKASRVEVLDGSFEEFLQGVVDQLDHLSTPLSKRPPLVVPVGRATVKIEASEYERDKRHFEILGTYLEGLTPPSVKESLNGSDNWASFLHRHFIDRACKGDFIELIDRCTATQPGLIVLGAPPGWGKTSLLRDVAVQLYQLRRPVIWLNGQGTLEIEINGQRTVTVGAWDTRRIDQVVSHIAATAEKHQVGTMEATPVIIVDDCPERAAEAQSLFRDLSLTHRAFVMIFAVRDNDYDRMAEGYPLLKKARYFAPADLYDTEAEIRDLIDLCIAQGVTAIEGPEQTDVIAQRIIGEEADKALILALQVIFDKQHRPFSEIVKDFWDDLGDDVAREVVLRVASVHRFGSRFSPRLYSLLKTFPAHTHATVLEAYRRCLNASVLFEHEEEGEPCVSCLHSLVAEHILKVSGRPPSTVDEKLLDIVRCMTSNRRDLELMRRMVKRIADYSINLSSEKKIEELFQVAAQATENDWVVCQQFAKHLADQRKHEQALVWAERALAKNPDYGPLHHTKGNVLRKWGMELLIDSRAPEANALFKKARESFGTSRVRREADEYGYVTHLDMLLSLIKREIDPLQKASLIAEGVALYREGIRSVPEEHYNFLLEDRFRETFDLNSKATKDLCMRIRDAVHSGKASVYAAAFWAQHLYDMGEWANATEALELQREASGESVLLWVKEAELRSKLGDFAGAAKCLGSAKRREKTAENAEVVWKLYYWDLLVSVVLEDYAQAQTAQNHIRDSGLFARKRFPKGYIWFDKANIVSPDKRTFREHAKIWTGRIELVRAGGQYGQIALTNVAGEKCGIGFNPKYFSRKDLRRGDHIQFVLTILPSGIRADDLSSKPFVSTTEDLFVPWR